MKKGIHPDYSSVLVVMTDGSSYETKSTSRRKKILSKLDMDTKSHLFWSGGYDLNVVESGGQRAKFKKRFSLEASKKIK